MTRFEYFSLLYGCLIAIIFVASVIEEKSSSEKIRRWMKVPKHYGSVILLLIMVSQCSVWFDSSFVSHDRDMPEPRPHYHYRDY